MEAKDTRVSRRTVRTEKVVKRPDPSAGALEGADEVLRPEIDIFRSDRMRHVILFCAIDPIIKRSLDLLQECLIDIIHLPARLEAKATRIPAERRLAKKVFATLDPVMNDAEFARLEIKETIKIAEDDLVNIQKKRRPFELRESWLIKDKFHIDIRPLRVLIIENHPRGALGKRLRVDTFMKSRRIIGNANETERTMKVGLYATVKAIHVLRGIKGTPLQTQNVNWFVHTANIALS